MMLDSERGRKAGRNWKEGNGYMMLDRERGRKEMEGRKDMFYLTTSSAYFIYGYMMLDSERGRKAERNWKEGRKWLYDVG